MASGKGEGYVGQGLDVADILAVLFLSEMRYDPVDRGPGHGPADLLGRPLLDRTVGGTR